MSLKPFGEIFARGLIVSCQALPGEPLDDPAMMAAMARAAQEAGAVGIRANGMFNVSRIRGRCRIPVIAINKQDRDGFDVRITPTYEDALEVAKIGPDCVAIDGTARKRPGPDDLASLIRRIREEMLRLVMADVATHEEGVRAAELGADAVATTLSGYTGGEVPSEPDLDLVESLAKAVSVPVIAEGRYETPTQVAEALRRGAHAVVVGTAITRPQVITERFVAATRDLI